MKTMASDVESITPTTQARGELGAMGEPTRPEDLEMISKPNEDGDTISERDVVENAAETTAWKDSPDNPLNWPPWKKALQVIMISSAGFLT